MCLNPKSWFRHRCRFQYLPEIHAHNECCFLVVNFGGVYRSISRNKHCKWNLEYLWINRILLLLGCTVQWHRSMFGVENQGPHICSQELVQIFKCHGCPKMSRNIEGPVDTWQKTSRVHLLSALVTSDSTAPKTLTEGMVVRANSLCIMNKDTTTEVPHICFFISWVSRENSKMYDPQQRMKGTTACTKTSNSVVLIRFVCGRCVAKAITNILY